MMCEVVENTGESSFGEAQVNSKHAISKAQTKALGEFLKVSPELSI
jgi:hypothetical protein